MLFRTYLRAYRGHHGHTQVYMADELGVRVPTYKAWEYGINRPRLERDRARLANYFGLPIGKILGPAVIVDGELRSVI